MTQYKVTLWDDDLRGLLQDDEGLALLINHYEGLGYKLYTDSFSFLIETIIGQMLSNKAVDAIAPRLYKLCGGELTPASILRRDYRH